MTYEDVETAALAAQLDVLGGFTPEAGDETPGTTKALVLLGPREPGFWDQFTSSQEYRDGRPDPLDRWSTRVIDALADRLGGQALFPFGGPPYRPFYRWALRTGRCHVSPLKLLVHDRAGLFVSFRGALALPMALDWPMLPPAPCETCATQPCRSACPVGALSDAGYDVGSCRGYLHSSAGADCLGGGCRARRACPVSSTYGRVPEQSAFHMTAFVTS